MTEVTSSENQPRRRDWEGVGFDNPAMDNSTAPSRQSGYLDDEIGPAENEVYESSVHVNSEDPPPAVVVADNSPSVFEKVVSGIRSLWATRETENTEENRELHIKTTLRELVIYVVFLIVLCIVTFGMTSPTTYYYTKVMSELFLDTTFEGKLTTFRSMTTMHDFWRFSESSLVNGLYWETWYNGKNVSEDELGYIFYENKLLGVPRIRQLKVRNDSCTIHEDFKDTIIACYDAYDKGIEDRNPFGKMNGTAWEYHSASELGGSSHPGRLTGYGGGGYIQDLASTKSDSLNIILDLKEHMWLDRGTRAVFVDFTVYNANINLFCVVKLLVEFPATGGAIPSWSFRTVKLIRYVTVQDFFIMACECMFCLFILYYTIEEIIEIKKHKLKYLKSFWNLLDLVVIIISLVCIGFSIYRTLVVRDTLDKLLSNPESFADFEFLSFWQVQFNSALAITVFFAWVKVFKYISFNKTMTQLSRTLGSCAKDLAGFAVMFFIIFLAFAQLGYLIFGTEVKDFSTFGNAVFTLLRIILGDFNFHELEEAERILGPIYFILYVFFVFFVLLNMFLAIINDTYSAVKEDLANQKSEFEMSDYFKKGYSRMKEKLNFKRDKIMDIQKAIQAADINQDRMLDFEEWRRDLKTRGYREAEIEAVFAKYDQDADRVLDENEQSKMNADLEGQRAVLNKEYEDIEERANRPGFDSGDESDDEDSGTKSSRTGRVINGVSYDEFTVLSRRVDRMEHSIGSIVSKIDAVLVKLEAMERAKSRRRETMSKLLDSITEADGSSDESKREQMEKLVREELERWDSESSISQPPGGARGVSPGGSSSGNSGGVRAHSRPIASVQNNSDYFERNNSGSNA